MLPFKNSFNYQYYTPDTFRRFLANFKDAPVDKKRHGKTIVRYYDIPIGFDIECSSFLDPFGDKVGLMYVWQICVNGIVFLGRTYKEFYNMLSDFKSALALGYAKRVVFYVHNLQYEFNVLRKYIEVVDYFAINSRKPLYAVDIRGIEFRCSYQLSGYSLAYLGDHMLHKYIVHKNVGDLDYSLIRTPETPLTRSEIGYTVNDARVVCNYIQERLERGQTLAKIELTKTGAVRVALVKHCLHKDGRKLNKSYIEYMQHNTIDSPETYKEIREAVQGGFTHSNPYNTNKVFLMSDNKGVLHMDIASDYPFIMATMKAPTGPPIKKEKLTLEEYNYLRSRGYHIIARFRFRNIKATFLWDYYLSRSRCRDIVNEIESNGRVVSASKLITTITEVDYDIIEKTYSYDTPEIFDALIYQSAYLPKEFVETVLLYYKNKTSLKGVAGREVEYMNSKELVNSIYGCILTDIVRPIFTYDTETGYGSESPDISEILDKYNSRKKRTSTYIWGAYVTAWARHKLWTEGIIPAGANYIYSDTDSIFAIESPELVDHFNKVNDQVMEKLRTISFIRRIPLEDFMPETIKGVKKPLGVWESEGVTDFKTLGAKRYITRDQEGRYRLTCAGLKKDAIEYIEKKGGFAFFRDLMKVPESDSGRLTVTYIDDKRGGYVTDYLGNRYHYRVSCGVHMEKSDYTLSLNKLFVEFLKGALI